MRKDISTFVVAPIDKMTSVIKKLASTVCFLSEGENGGGDDEQYETDVIENLLEKMAGVFNVGLAAPTKRLKASICFLYFYCISPLLCYGHTSK